MHGDRGAWVQRLAASPVRVQWDPERSLRLDRLPYRSLQVGLSGAAVDRYVDEWTVTLTDVTTHVQRIHKLLRAANEQAAAALLPTERPYPLPPSIAEQIHACPSPPPTAADTTQGGTA